MKTNDNILIIGRPKTGKSCLKGQLATRLSETDSQVKEYKKAKNIEAVNKITDSQAVGVNPARTSKEFDAETIFHLEFEDGEKADLIWPDYAGEKITDIVKYRKLPKSWLPLVQESSVWMLFVRLDKLKPIDNLLLRPQENITKLEKEKKDENEEKFTYEISDYAFFVELLQMLLFHRGLSTLNPVNSPVLQVVLTFWDDLEKDENSSTIVTPREELVKKCPMLVEFIESIWSSTKVSYVGLSPQGMSLAEKIDDVAKSEAIQDFADAPEEHGYIIKNNGKREDDLTYLVHHAVKLAK